jgi:hypothetical protein
MFRINLHGLIADLGLGTVIAAAAPFYAIVLIAGWGWRGWLGIANLAMSFAIYARKPASIG